MQYKRRQKMNINNDSNASIKKSNNNEVIYDSEVINNEDKLRAYNETE